MKDTTLEVVVISFHGLNDRDIQHHLAAESNVPQGFWEKRVEMSNFS
jgi:16S rRNA C1402 N4-methylase RsmH